MLKWMLGFIVVAIAAAIIQAAFDVPAAGTVAIISFILALLLFAGRLFERTASA